MAGPLKGSATGAARSFSKSAAMVATFARITGRAGSFLVLEAWKLSTRSSSMPSSAWVSAWIIKRTIFSGRNTSLPSVETK